MNARASIQEMVNMTKEKQEKRKMASSKVLGLGISKHSAFRHPVQEEWQSSSKFQEMKSGAFTCSQVPNTAIRQGPHGREVMDAYIMVADLPAVLSVWGRTYSTLCWLARIRASQHDL